MFPLQAISAFTQINCGVSHKEQWFYSLLQAVLSHPRWVDEVGLTWQSAIQLVTPVLPLFSSVGGGGPNEPERQIHLHVLVWQKLLASLWEGEGGWLGWAWPHAQSCPGISCTTSPGDGCTSRSSQATGRSSLPLAHPWTPAVLREKKPPRILQFKFSYVMSRAKCHEAWDCLLSHHL